MRTTPSTAGSPSWAGNSSRTYFPDARRSGARHPAQRRPLRNHRRARQSRQDGNNGTNARIFIPIETMRNLFPLKGENIENAISFINYRPLDKAQHLLRNRKSTRSSPAVTASIPNSKIPSKTGTPLKTRSAWTRFSTPWITSWAWWDSSRLRLGAIGIINIMLVSVTERTREIGLRKALGATHRNILTQFFVEGAFLTALSGGIGLLHHHWHSSRCWRSCPRPKDSTRRASSRVGGCRQFSRSLLPASPPDCIPRARPRSAPVEALRQSK